MSASESTSFPSTSLPSGTSWDRILFASDEDGDLDLFVLDAGSDTRRITDNQFFDGEPMWSPDGQRWLVLPVGEWR